MVKWAVTRRVYTVHFIVNIENKLINEMYQQTDSRVNGSTDSRVNGSTDQQSNGLKDQRINVLITFEI